MKPLRLVVGAAVLAAVIGAGLGLTRAAVTFQDESISLEPGDIRPINAATPLGGPLRGALSWTVEPSWLGKMDDRGGFHAGEISGSGTATARVGPASAQVAVNVTCPKAAEIQGIRFEVSCGRTADVYVEIGVAGGAGRAGAEVDREADRVARALQMESDRRFRVYYLGSVDTLRRAVSWLGRGFTNGPAVQETEAVYMDLVDLIALDQSQARLMDTGPVVRHELVHRALRQLAGPSNIDAVPTWLNEGWAHLEETDAGWTRTEARLVAASSAHLDRLPSLAQLTDQGDWNRRTGLEGLYQYYIASLATQFLIDDITLPAVNRALKLMATEKTFARALARAAPAFDYDAFANHLSDRLEALVSEYPGIVAAQGSPDGVGSTVIAYGLRPGAPATLTLTGAAQRVFSGSVDAYGVYVKYIGAELPVGEYRVTLETDGRRFQVSATR